jgi:hypothetical protein
MPPNIQPRKEEDGGEPSSGGLTRRATDTSLKGMQIRVDDSDKAWSEWQDALSDKDQVPPENTQPLPLNPDS